MVLKQYSSKNRVVLSLILLLGLIQKGYGQTISTLFIPTNQCTGNSINVNFSVTGSFNAGNIFTAQLSNQAGSFVTPVNIGSVAGTSSGTINATIPVATTAGAGYRIRVVGSNPAIIGSNNGSNIIINSSLNPTVSLNVNPLGAICPGTSVSFYASTTNVGPTVLYEFKVNGATVQNGPLSSYTSNSFNDGDNVTCTITTSGGPCASSVNATSIPAIVNVSSSIVPSVSITTVPPGAICMGNLLVFIATAVGTSGGSVNYDFRVNGVSAQSSGSNTFIAPGLVNGDVVSCILTIVGPGCLLTNTANSNVINILVNPTSTPSVFLSANQVSPICSGTPVTFTATSAGLGGGVPNYDFRINGMSVQSGSSNTFTTTSLTDFDLVSCTMTVTGGICLTANPVWSNMIMMNVNPSFTPAVTLAGFPVAPLCPGTMATFTATATGTGSSTVNYTFRVNGVAVQSSSSNVYSTAALNNGDVVTCTINTTGGTCMTATSANSNPVTTSVLSSITPNVNLASNPAGPICAGATISFSATAGSISGGAVNYDFRVNGVSVQTGSSSLYSTNSLNNGDVVSCIISVSGVTCLSSSTASSNSIIVVVNSIITPGVGLSANQASPICAGTPVTFTASPISTGGGAVVYDFKRNGLSVQTGSSATYTTNSLVNGDVISCSISVSGVSCLSSNTANSNVINFVVNPVSTPAVNLNSTLSGPICAGTPVNFTANSSGLAGGTVIYDFKVNGSTVQSGPSNIYSSSSLANGSTVSCSITVSGGTCLTSNNANSNSIIVTVNPVLNPAVSLTSAPAGAICPGSMVTFTATGNNSGTATLTYDFRVNGVSVQNTSSNVFSSGTLVNGDVISCVMNLTGGTCLSQNTVTSNTITTVVNSSLTPAVSLASNQPGPVCAGTSIAFTAAAANTGGGSITYEFRRNGISVQSGASNIYTSNALVNGDVITCNILITGGTCLAANSAASNSITINVNPILDPAVNIAAMPAGPVCAGSSITFTANSSNTGGGTIIYDFRRNGVSVQSSSSNSFTSTTLANGDIITCTINITGGTCLSSNTVSSNQLTTVVNPNLTPGVNLSSNLPGPICAGTSVTFTSTSTNTGGGTVSYDFRRNGISVQTGASNTFTSTALANGDIITCTINIAGGTCLTTNASTSNSITVTVSPILTPTVAISVSPAGPICAGTSVSFTATAASTGTGPLNYDFKVNGLSVQSGASNSFSSSALSNADVVTCTISTSGSCLSSNTADSNPINMTVNPVVTPAVAISALPAGPICAGTSISFTANASNTAGGTLIYDFRRNGISVQSGASNMYSSTALADGDVITCTVTISGGTCLSSNSALSNSLTTVVNPNLTPAVSLATNQPGPICAGTSVTFTSTSTNTGGGTVSYDFRRNGISVQTGPSNSFTSTTLANGDIITCTITVSGGICLASNNANSNTIGMVVNPNVTPAVSLAVSPATPVCSGTPVTFTAAASNTNGGTVTYDFRVNGISVQNTSSNIFTSSIFNNNDNVTCTIFINGASCLTTDNVNSNALRVLVNPILRPAVSINSPGGPFCPGEAVTFIASTTNIGSANVNYEFKVNGVSVQSSSNNSFTSNQLKITDKVSCTISLTGGSCLANNSATSSTLSPNYSNIACPDQIYVPTGFTPNNDGKNDVFRPVVYGNVKSYRFSVYNRWGQKVFESTDPQKGWDGKLNGSKMDSNTFVWMVVYQFGNLPQEVKKGTVTLIR